MIVVHVQLLQEFLNKVVCLIVESVLDELPHRGPHGFTLQLVGQLYTHNGTHPQLKMKASLHHTPCSPVSIKQINAISTNYLK